MPLKVIFGASFFFAGNVCPLKHGIMDLFAKKMRKRNTSSFPIFQPTKRGVRTHFLQKLGQQFHSRKIPEKTWATKKTLLYFPLNPGWLIGILISWFIINPYITGFSTFIPSIQQITRGPFFIAHMNLFDPSFQKTPHESLLRFVATGGVAGSLGPFGWRWRITQDCRPILTHLGDCADVEKLPFLTLGYTVDGWNPAPVDR